MRFHISASVPLALALSLLAGRAELVHAQTGEPAAPALGRYFAKKQYTPKPLPGFAEFRDRLPAPIYDEKPEYAPLYWKAWELAFKNFHEPAPDSGFVTQFIDAAFNQNIFLWDSCFMTMFCNYAHPLAPGIGTLDNFYAKQHEDGEICREINRRTGRDYADWVNREGKGLFSRWGWNTGQAGLPRDPNAPVIYQGRKPPETPPELTLDALNHPILAWAELESYRVTGDTNRLAMVFEPLVRYYRALQTYLRQGNGLYMTDWASMDNSARNPWLKNGGTGIDISAEMALFARNLAEIATVLGRRRQARDWLREAGELARRINRQMWDPQRRFYFDLSAAGERGPVKTIAAYWALLARVADRDQAGALVAELNNPATFKRLHRVPTLAANESGYDPSGGYWQGAVWEPTDTMVIRGLENYGYHELARELALEHLERVSQVFQKTGTVWENYAPEAIEPGKPARKDFVGWSGLGPILYLLEYAIGLKPNAPRNEVVWELRGAHRQGCERFRFGGHVASLVAEPQANPAGRMKISVASDGAFRLRIRQPRGETRRTVRPGEQSFVLDQNTN